MREFLRSRHGHLLSQIADTGMMDEDAMRTAIESFQASREPAMTEDSVATAAAELAEANAITEQVEG